MLGPLTSSSLFDANEFLGRFRFGIVLMARRCSCAVRLPSPVFRMIASCCKKGVKFMHPFVYMAPPFLHCHSSLLPLLLLLYHLTVVIVEISHAHTHATLDVEVSPTLLRGRVLRESVKCLESGRSRRSVIIACRTRAAPAKVTFLRFIE